MRRVYPKDTSLYTSKTTFIIRLPLLCGDIPCSQLHGLHTQTDRKYTDDDISRSQTLICSLLSSTGLDTALLATKMHLLYTNPRTCYVYPPTQSFHTLSKGPRYKVHEWNRGSPTSSLTRVSHGSRSNSSYGRRYLACDQPTPGLHSGALNMRVSDR
jgi:hypothetical protein